MLSFLPAISHPPPSVRATPQEGEAGGEVEDAGAGGLRAWAPRQAGYSPVALSARCVLRACFCKYLSRLSQGKVSYFGSVTPDSTNLSVVALLLVTAEVGAEEA